MKHSLTVFLLSAIVLSSCRTSGLATRDQYLESIYWQENSMPDKALESFPKNEEGGFVTTLEKAG
ncbi:MAG: hypothetical protein R3B45_05080 [Bdellovibrionota bacterium]